MSERKNLIYDFREHGLYYIPEIEDTPIVQITLVIDTLQIQYDYCEEKIVSIGGYFPLLHAKSCLISMPKQIETEYRISMRGINPIPGIAYDYFKYFPNSREYFIESEFPITAYDEVNKRILIGDASRSKADRQATEHIVCSCDENGNLCSILIQLDEIIH